MKKYYFILINALLMILTTSIGVYASTLIIDPNNKQLLGANNVTVLGSNYDVRFSEELAVDIWGTNLNFTFTTADQAKAAADALRSQLLISYNGVDYDQNPEMTFGISSETEGCLFTPYSTVNEGAHIIGVSVNNTTATNEINTSSFQSPVGWDMQRISFMTWVTWTPSVSPTPEPSTILLFGLGLLGVAGVSRKQ